MSKKSKKSKEKNERFIGAIVVMIFISLTVTGLAASLVKRNHHDGVAIAHLTIALVLLPLGWIFPLSAVCWLGALITLVSVPSSRHILAAQLNSDDSSNGTSIGASIGENFIPGVVQDEQAWAHGPYMGLCACDILGIILGVMGTWLMP